MKKIVFIFILLKSFVIFSKDSTKILFSPYIDFGQTINQSIQFGTILETKKFPLQLSVGLIITNGFFNEEGDRNIKPFDYNKSHFDDQIQGAGYSFSLRYLKYQHDKFNFLHNVGINSITANIRYFENIYTSNGSKTTVEFTEFYGRIKSNKIYYQMNLQTKTRKFVEVSPGIVYSFSKIDSVTREYRDYSLFFWDFGHNGLSFNIALKVGYRFNK